ncbi:MAG: ATP-binding protein [Deltaproteobacteria bacterium]|jgi:hypothetical protein|nr:ATP-binding protein [Deltaproteobacteria bacterium]
MSKTFKNLPVGLQSFPKIIQEQFFYLDKTDFIARMIDEKAGPYFLARPRRFGKSLLISTLAALFSGKREFFTGLAIEKRLDEKIFAARPVIRLDMSYVKTNIGFAEFYRTLGRMTSSSAIWQGSKWSLTRFLFASPKSFDFNPSAKLSPAEILTKLIEKLAKKSGRKVVVLIDEYDKPYLDLLNMPDEAEKVRDELRAFYTILKASDDHISFTFITGISKFTRTGVFSAINNIRDISVSPEYAALCGFTHDELARRFEKQIDEAASKLGKNRDDLLEELRDYYDGFSFDGVTRVYNPFSTLLFFVDKRFDNYWFDSGTSQVIAQYIKDNRLTVEEFRGMEVSRAFVKNPGEINNSGPESYLYQSGYLSVRAGKNENIYTLDYPNREVYESMSRLLVDNFIGNTAIADGARINSLKAFENGDVNSLIKIFNELLAKIPYDIYSNANRKTIKINNIEINFNEWLFHSNILSFLIGAGLDARAENHTSHGQSDLVIIHGRRAWVLELKMVRNGNDATVAKTALKQIMEKDYVGPYANPILLGIAINESKRTISAWEAMDDETAKSQRGGSR